MSATFHNPWILDSNFAHQPSRFAEEAFASVDQPNEIQTSTMHRNPVMAWLGHSRKEIEHPLLDHRSRSFERSSSEEEDNGMSSQHRHRGIHLRNFSWTSFSNMPHAAARLPPPHDSKAKPFNGWAVAISGACYCLSSVMMVLVNKLALTAFPHSSATVLLFLQCGLCALLVGLGQMCGLLQSQTLTVGMVKTWLPGNVLFVAMLWTSFVALHYLHVPTVIILKNLANFFTIIGDYLFFGRKYAITVWMSLFFMVASAVASGVTDLEFNAQGYAWQILNCLITAAYSLYIKRAIHAAEQHTVNKEPLHQSTMVLLNNTLSLPMLLMMVAMTGEMERFTANVAALQDMDYALTAGVSGLISLAVSYCSLSFISHATPTSYSLVGNLNKIPTAVGSYLIFHDLSFQSPSNLASIGLGIIAGMVFVAAKGGAQPKSTGRDNMSFSRSNSPTGAPQGAPWRARWFSFTCCCWRKVSAPDSPSKIQFLRQESYVRQKLQPNPFETVITNPLLAGVLQQDAVIGDVMVRPVSRMERLPSVATQLGLFRQPSYTHIP